MIIRHPQYDVLEASIELRGGTTDRIVTIADMRAAEPGVAFAADNSRRFGPALAAPPTADGRLRIRIDRSLPLTDAAKAQELSEAGHPRGTLILHP
ncbi:zinc-binding dehydrogenase [Streptomyces kebangsaanensis]|uniref:Zinc-binding dehydrogenase n=1 Tax=Streptomyces kebangsaanensis TaxID=864058 RepID=A0ABW6KUT0_9ACTN